MTELFNKILFIDDDENLSRVVSFQLRQMGFEVATASDGEQGLKQFKQNGFDIVLTDLQLPGMDGMALLSAIRRLDKRAIIIIITAYGSVENAIEASHLGADDYLTKPFGKETLRFILEKTIRFRQLEVENLQLRSELYQKYDFHNLIGKSAAMEAVLKLTGQVAASDATVLIQGESGTGKELIARAIHYNSPRKERPFITVNCPSIPENLMESELFGHVRGAFTGALKDRKGKFQLADKGTLFLDEIGDMKEDLQAKLLRVLQEKEFERLGESDLNKVDVRVVAATNKNLDDLVRDGQFREDLYYRLNVVSLMIPPLRDRRDDIPFLVDHFIQKYSKGQHYRIADDALKMLCEYDYPGNVRELANMIERAIVISKAPLLTADLFLPLQHIKRASRLPDNANSMHEDMTLEEIERKAILQALGASNGNQTKAAQRLAIPRHVLIYRMKKLGITTAS
ncbi:sigma-54-dependent Fis family transcriptional regulator [candidate division KSB1 bacterium]|nr:sigma-54-dependent Fis family transcriptional regulator [candidate division KSB1 bacterium]